MPLLCLLSRSADFLIYVTIGVGEEHMPISKLNRHIVEAAIVGFEHQKTLIDNQIAELRAMLNGIPAETAATAEPAKPQRRKRSLAVRRRMALAQKERWAKIKGEAAPQAPAPAAKPKRKLTAAGRAAIVAATKKRWAAVRAAKTKSAATKKTALARKKAAVKKAAAKAIAPAAE
jgi:hypothetical protein